MNKGWYEIALECLEKHFGRGSHEPSDALDLAYFLAGADGYR